jgi:hypothetical protein
MKANPSKNYVSMCGNKCVYSDSESSALEAVCKLPSLSTSKSVTTYKIETPGHLDSKVYFGTSSNDNQAKLFDKNNMNYNDDSSSACNVGMQFREGYVGVLTKVRFFLGDSQLMTVYAGKTKFQGSMDGTTYTDIFTFDDNVHTGWNYQEWNDTASQPSYTYYRFSGESKGCNINEAELTGVETVKDTADTHDCVPVFVFDGAEQSITGAITYSGPQTALLTNISPRYGTVLGGDDVTFTGTGFSATKEDYTITIDGIDCPVESATTTSVTCKTGKRPGLRNSTLEIMIKNKGLVSTQGLLFTYANYWSSETTWGGDFAPIEDESVYIPKGLNLLVDIDSSPLLKAIVVEGSLIFAPHKDDATHERFFDARYIFLNGGTMEVGTEQFPYTSKITITMHGTVKDPYLPIYGNKCIGVKNGKLDMHGPTRTPTWTVLDTTAVAGSNTLTLKEAVDWVAGEYISIAPTDFEVDHAEYRMIKSIDKTTPGKPVITLDKNLKWKHYAGT